MTPAQPVKHGSTGRGDLASFRPVLAAFAVVAIGFVVATVYSELHARAIDREAALIETNALPSVEHLAAARAALWHLEAATRHYVEEPGQARLEAATTLDAAMGEVNREVLAEFATELYPGEASLQADTRQKIDALTRSVRRMQEEVVRSETSGLSFERGELHRQVEDADAAIERLVSLNAMQGRAEAARIAGIRSKSIQLLVVLNIGGIFLSIGAALVAFRSLRRQRDLERAHERLIEERAAELEVFASRVAHDLLSPLSALHFNLSSLERSARKGMTIDEPLERARACLKRSQTLVNCVMDFARSGGAQPSGRASLRTTLDGVLEEVRTESSGVAFCCEGIDEAIFVACPVGVLTSVLSNLVQNAVKYLGERADRRVTIRAQALGATVRVEVEDTGPGLAPGLEHHVFEPYVRSPDNPKPGLGIGLATVQRFVESHRGRVGVDSLPDQGCSFWFELPRAPGMAFAE